MATKDEKKTLWVGWTHDAMARYEMPVEIDDEEGALEDLVDEMADVATDYADAMLEEYEYRFEGGTRRKRRKKSKEVVDDDDDPDDD
jgi:hypothetical protein